MKQLLTLLLATLLTSGCGTMNPRDFSDSSQRLDLFDYFEGHTLAWGLFEDRFGKLRRQFRVDITGTVDGDTLVLEEGMPGLPAGEYALLPARYALFVQVGTSQPDRPFGAGSVGADGLRLPGPQTDR